MSLDLESAARVELLTCFITHLFVFSCFYLPHFNALLVVSFYALIDNVCYIFFRSVSSLCVCSSPYMRSSAYLQPNPSPPRIRRCVNFLLRYSNSPHSYPMPSHSSTPTYPLNHNYDVGFAFDVFRSFELSESLLHFLFLIIVGHFKSCFGYENHFFPGSCETFDITKCSKIL